MQLRAHFAFSILLQLRTCFILLTKEMFSCSLSNSSTGNSPLVINRNSIDWDPIRGPNSPSNQHNCLLCLLHWYLRWISNLCLATSYLKVSTHWLPSPKPRVSCDEGWCFPSQYYPAQPPWCLVLPHTRQGYTTKVICITHPTVFFTDSRSFHTVSAASSSLSKRSSETQVFCRPVSVRVLFTQKEGMQLHPRAMLKKSWV